MKFFLVLFAFILIVKANEIENKQTETFDSIESIKSINKGIKRDFYINKYFKKDITEDEALNALSFVDNLSNDMFYNFAKKFRHDETLAVAQCMNMTNKELIDSYADCIVNGFSLKDISTLSSIDLELIKQKTSDKYPHFTKILNIFSSSIPFTKLILLKKDDFYNVFLNVSDDFRIKYFNYKLPQRTFKRIFEDKTLFDKFLQVSLTNPKLKILQKSFIKIDDSELNLNSSFLLALNAVRLNDFNTAFTYLSKAQNKTIDKKISDKIIFWKYLVTKNDEYLIELSNSLNINLYSLYANELLGKKLDDYNFLEKIDAFDLLLKDYDKNRVSLLYSIAKVKSNFDVNKISKKFELGIMQLDYKLIESLSSKLFNENSLMFNPFSLENNLNLANAHLNNIEKNLSSSIFIVLSYQGDKEYLNKKLANDLFSRESILEPHMSLELISNKEYKYLKDILMYRYLYQNYLAKKKKEKITLLSIFENLFEFSQKLDD